MTDNSVTAVIPVHLPNLDNGYLNQAIKSVARQTRPVDAISVAVDSTHAGAAVTRTRAVHGVETEWCAFLDSDDLWYPHHVEVLLETAEKTGADLVFPWFDVPRGYDPFPEFEGQPFNAGELRVRNYIPITVLVRTLLISQVGGFTPKGPPENPCEDHGTWLKLLDAGAKFVHHNGRTWQYLWHKGNTSGRGDVW